MKYIKHMLAFGLLMSAATLSFAATNVVVFNPQAAILRSDTAQKQLEELRGDSDYASMQARLESLKTDLEGLRKESETKGMTWSADQVAEHRKKMESVGSDLQYTAKKMQSEQQSVLERIMQQMQPKVEKALSEVVKEVGADLVLDSQSAFFAAPKADITAKVTEKLNKAK
jgi:outer membrane protein